MLANALLDTPLLIVPEMDAQALEEEWTAMIDRGMMLQKLLDGAIDWETYLDFMAEQGYEPSELLDAAEENLEYAVQSDLVIQR